MAIVSAVFQPNIFQDNAFQDNEFGTYAFQPNIFQKNVFDRRPQIVQPINELTLSLTEGWNLISGISTPVDADVLYSSGLVITGGIYGYDGSYFNADVIYPGRGYWVRANNSGSIILTSE